MSWNGRNVLVTGAAGFIGSHLVESLVTEGARVRAFVRYVSSATVGNLAFAPREIVRAVEIVRGDLRDPDAVRNASRGIDTLFHLGALIAIPYSYVHPREVVETNVLGTLNVLQAARDAGVRRTVHTSTSEVYGSARYTPIDESHPMQGQSPYAASKIGADRIVESFHRSFGTPVVALRPFNTYGPRQSARAVIPTIITQALSSNEVRLGSLDTIRDFTFVDDTVSGFLRVAEAEDVLGEEINLGTGVAVSIGDLASKIFDILGKSPTIVTDERRVRPTKSEVMHLLASNAKAAARIGWRPRVSLADGLVRTVEWIRSHLETYRPEEYTV